MKSEELLQFQSSEITLFRYLFAQCLGELAPALADRQGWHTDEAHFAALIATAKHLAIEGEKVVLAYEEELRRGR